MPQSVRTCLIASIQIGKVRSEGIADADDPLQRRWTTGFYKTPVCHAVTVSPQGIVGDEVADKVNHGGPDKAVLAYAARHYAAWRQSMQLPQLSAGAFGENMTLDDVDESEVCIGDRWQADDVEFEVSQPRQPCWKLARRWSRKSLVKEVAQSGRTGWYLRVLASGRLAAGQQLRLVDRPYPAWTVARANDILFGRAPDREAVMELMELPKLAEAWKASLG